MNLTITWLFVKKLNKTTLPINTQRAICYTQKFPAWSLNRFLCAESTPNVGIVSRLPIHGIGEPTLLWFEDFQHFEERRNMWEIGPEKVVNIEAKGLQSKIRNACRHFGKEVWTRTHWILNTTTEKRRRPQTQAETSGVHAVPGPARRL